MERTTNFLSELEAEMEAGFDTATQAGNNSETDNEFELESDNEFESDNENDSEFELDSESDNEFENDSESDNEFESDNESGEDYSGTRNYESRLSRLLSQGSDSELEFDQELNDVLHEMEQEFFFKGLKKWAKKGLKAFKSIAGKTPLGQMVSVASSLARGNIRDMLRRAASLALKHGAGFIPGASALSPFAARALNLEMEADQEASISKAKDLVKLAQHSYQNLASQIDPRMTNARTAKSMAQSAINKAFASVRQSNRYNRGNAYSHTNRVVVHVSANAWQKIKNGGSLVIKVK